MMITKQPYKLHTLRTLTLIGLCALIASCKVVGPEYERPSTAVPPSYKEAIKLSNAQNPPLEQRWWERFGDNELNSLITQVETQNYSLQALEARSRQALAVAEAAQAARHPSVVAGGKNDLGILVSWEIDLWGRIRRNIEASGASAQASKADLAAMQLSLQAQLAQNYFLLRAQDAEIGLFQDTVKAYQRSVQIAQNRVTAGVADKGSLSQAQTQLSSAQAQMHDARVLRAQLEHAIAVLIGKAPADFSLETATFSTQIPSIPAALPAELLQRRPDIAAAERRMAAASARIGVAEASAYPTLGIFAGVTIRKGIVGGADTALPLYTGGAVEAGRSAASAAYDAAVAEYQQAVLNGFREVEDNLAALQALEDTAQAQNQAVKAAQDSTTIANNQYRAGVANYQSVVLSQSNALNNERAALGILGRRLVASVTLMKALGGGWNADALSETDATTETESH